MTWRTHLMGGVCSLAPLLLLPPESLAPGEAGLLALVACLGALLPDLDASESHLKHLRLIGTDLAPFALTATLLHQSLGHRGLLHSLAGLGLGALLLAVPVGLWLGPLAGLALVLGYASHLALDACTKAGIPLLFPNLKRRHLLPRWLRVTTGSLAEEPVFVGLALLALIVLLGLSALSSAATVFPSA
jgi:membrane-bound metal-dependent hydrolase YbcI (DUF457 family)